MSEPAANSDSPKPHPLGVFINWGSVIGAGIVAILGLFLSYQANNAQNKAIALQAEIADGQKKLEQERHAFEREKWKTEQKNQQAIIEAPEPHQSNYSPADAIAPFAPRSFTPISVPNRGNSQDLSITEVRLRKWKWIPTPSRQNLAGALEAVDIIFKRRHYLEDKGIYSLHLQEAISVKPGEWQSLRLWMVDKDLSGQSFEGTVTVVYDSGSTYDVSDVQIDVLPDTSAIEESRRSDLP